MPNLLVYLKERNRVLLTGNPDLLLAFMKKHGMPEPRDREQLEMTMHMAITGAVSLPIAHRRKSKAWLTERGYHSLDDGELG